VPRAFVIRPFEKKKDCAGNEFDFERVHQELIAKALQAVGLGGGTTGEIVEAGNVREDMFALIVEADLVVCDITVHNANVFYELGIRNALRKKNCILIRGTDSADAIPFDLLTDRYLKYPAKAPAGALSALIEMIQATLASDRETDSPVFKMLPGLADVDPATVQVVPADYMEEVQRASAAQSAGWLRLLASEVSGMRFQWPALRLVAQAQMKVGDYRGALATMESLRQNNPQDITADVGLANIYERLYRASQQPGPSRPELLEQSNQAIARVLSNRKATARERAEARGLEGRNLKTLWRLQWEHLPSLAERRQKAAKRILRESYEAYREAYLFDLNYYWPGLAALQQGTVMLELAKEDSWGNSFQDEEEAGQWLRKLQRQLEPLRHSIAQAFEGCDAKLPKNDKERVWLNISRADLMFLSSAIEMSRVVEAYDSAVPLNDLFAWDAAKGQLQLYQNIGFRADAANAVIRQVDARFGSKVKEDELQVVIFAGHQVDEAGRATPRFPASRETQARDLIHEQLAKLAKQAERPRVLASAAPGADIICHEVCAELGIESIVCLPMPNDDFSRNLFPGDLDAWRTRFLELVRRRIPIVNLSGEPGLPRWLLSSSGVNPWERGNRWVLEMARASSERPAKLIALWDGKLNSDKPGGTGHMVRIAREAGSVDVLVIDANQLVR
jgi:hypothetical protein